MVHFCHISVDQRQEHQENSEADDGESDGGGSDDMSVDDNTGVGLVSLIAEASSNSRRGPTRKMVGRPSGSSTAFMLIAMS